MSSLCTVPEHRMQYVIHILYAILASKFEFFSLGSEMINWKHSCCLSLTSFTWLTLWGRPSFFKPASKRSLFLQCAWGRCYQSVNKHWNERYTFEALTVTINYLNHTHTHTQSRKPPSFFSHLENYLGFFLVVFENLTCILKLFEQFEDISNSLLKVL